MPLYTLIQVPMRICSSPCTLDNIFGDKRVLYCFRNFHWWQCRGHGIPEHDYPGILLFRARGLPRCSIRRKTVHGPPRGAQRGASLFPISSPPCSPADPCWSPPTHNTTPGPCLRELAHDSGTKRRPRTTNVSYREGSCIYLFLRWMSTCLLPSVRTQFIQSLASYIQRELSSTFIYFSNVYVCTTVCIRYIREYASGKNAAVVSCVLLVQLN